ncbi:unnamed protein product [Leptosia nina]|uniref:Uncharacterized protein n=1 Tax=Leptosia nina TaxID=320188 RepID=A0AAV1J1H7_9NEOP
MQSVDLGTVEFNKLLVLCSSYWWDKVSVKEADEPLVPVDPFMIKLHYPRCTRIEWDALHNWESSTSAEPARLDVDEAVAVVLLFTYPNRR